MPGPNSAPNGDRSLVVEIVGYEKDGRPIRKREVLRNKNLLKTGKTESKRKSK